MIEPGACWEHGGNVEDCERGSGGEECFAATRRGPVGSLQGAVEAKEQCGQSCRCSPEYEGKEEAGTEGFILGLLEGLR